MFRRSSNNPWIPPKGINSPAFLQIGGEDPSPGAGARFPGQLGQTVVHSTKTALQDSNLSIGTLFEGVYQLVKFAAAVTTVTRGQLLFWNTSALNGISTFEVATAASSAGNFRAGIALNDETAAGGKFPYIQVAGLATARYGAIGGTAGELVIQATAVNVPLLTVATVNTITDATVPGTMLFVKALVGRAYGTPPGAAGVGTILMDLNAFVPNVG